MSTSPEPVPEHDSPLELSLPDGAGRRVLVTGATGYVGGRLIPELLAAGFAVRATARHPADLDSRPWRSSVEAVKADLQDADEVRAAMQDVRRPGGARVAPGAAFEREGGGTEPGHRVAAPGIGQQEVRAGAEGEPQSGRDGHAGHRANGPPARRP